MPRAHKVNESQYGKWTAIAGTLVAILSLLLNVFLGISNLNIDQKLKSLELQNKMHEASVDMEAQYLMVSGSTLRDVEHVDLGDSGRQSAIVKNQVLQDLSDKWTVGWHNGMTPLVGEGGHTRSHGVLFYLLANRGKQDAQQIILTYKGKVFPNDYNGSEDYSGDSDIPTAENLWELNTSNWQTNTQTIRYLRAGESVAIPLAHVLGTNGYFGHVEMPVQMEWFNPTLQKPEKTVATGLLPNDQWISESLDISWGQ